MIAVIYKSKSKCNESQYVPDLLPDLLGHA